MTLTLERLREVLSYDPESGQFRWLVRPSNRVRLGDVAGSRVKMGVQWYIQIRIDNVLYQGHRLAWFYVHGVWPEEVDHRDVDGTNNRLSNLRLATSSENKCNRRMQSNNACGFKGVSLYRPTNRYRAEIRFAGKRHYLGYFATPEEAHAAYVAASNRVHGDFARSA